MMCIIRDILGRGNLLWVERMSHPTKKVNIRCNNKVRPIPNSRGQVRVLRAICRLQFILIRAFPSAGMLADKDEIPKLSSNRQRHRGHYVANRIMQ